MTELAEESDPLLSQALVEMYEERWRSQRAQAFVAILGFACTAALLRIFGLI